MTTPRGVDIVGYRVIVSREDPLREFAVDLPPEETAVTVPAAFLEEDTEYDLEVLAVERSGNQTITEQGLVTSG